MREHLPLWSDANEPFVEANIGGEFLSNYIKVNNMVSLSGFDCMPAKSNNGVIRADLVEFRPMQAAYYYFEILHVVV